jgi:hypothetical protein
LCGQLPGGDQVGVQLSYINSAFLSTLYCTMYQGKGTQNKVPENFFNAGRFWGTRGFKTKGNKILKKKEELAKEDKNLSTHDNVWRGR